MVHSSHHSNKLEMMQQFLKAPFESDEHRSTQLHVFDYYNDTYAVQE